MQCGLTDEIEIGRGRGPGLVQSFLKSVVDPDGMVAIAKAEGFDISVAPLSESQEEITEGELEDVAGGLPGQGCFNNSQRQFRTGV